MASYLPNTISFFPRFSWIFFLSVGLFVGGIAPSIQAQSLSQVVRGQVLDAESGAAIAMAHLVVENAEPVVETDTDEEGFFHLPAVPIGRQTLTITAEGYQAEVLKEFVVASGKALFLEVTLQERSTQLDTVTIAVRTEEPVNSMAVVSARSFGWREVNQNAGSLTDPLRMAQSLPGITITDDDANDVSIRGNSPRGMLWRLEGIEIPNPNHFKTGDGSSGGGITVFSSNVLQRSDVLSGAFPAEYGNALSGVFDMRLRNGNTDKQEYAFQLGVLGVEAGLEGPINRKKGSSYLVNYRYSTLQLLNVIGVVDDEEEAVPEYQDLSLKLNFPTQKAGTFSIFGIGGLSDAREPSGLDSVDIPIDSLDYWDFRNQRMGVIGVSNLYLLENNRTYFRTVASLQFLRLFNNISYREDSTSETFVPSYVEEFDYPTGRLSWMVNHKVNTANVIRAGVVGSLLGYKLKVSDLNYVDNSYTDAVNVSGATPFVQAYAQWKHRFGQSVESHLGVHTAYLELNQQGVIEPRIGIKWKLNPRNAISAGVGMHSRMDPLSVYSLTQADTLPGGAIPNQNLGFQQAIHNVLGWSFFPTENLRLTLEGYYQYLYNVPVGVADQSFFTTLNHEGGYLNSNLVNEGTGYNYGVELTFERRFVDQYFFLASGTAFDSRYQGADGIVRNTAYNYGWTANGTGGKEFVVGKRRANTISLFLRGTARGGTPLVPIDLDASRTAGKTVYDLASGYTERAATFSRFDFGFWFRINKPKHAWIISLDVQNIANQQNVKNRIFNPRTDQIEEVTMLGLVPILNFKILL